ncbi:TPA: site-specific integrase [Streptococcus agalactiae]|uniref:Site-specific recombinase, phage integrase family n=1 Tax=Streptococcus urinalis 2285-97 TaxID=764291 RepID=G5KF68_9STRE|nr:site-specific integrase [Streptococcus urinalis]EHJ56475.1 site-specific recombinase, phage integrase family [Streptococcus urinalis 2285-97]EKS18137.1 hypothetical protein HMPREF9318_01636 [Streptococcus urinalis FB127-CNA-2]VEF33038.1 integrase [Streptococcus urinalis]HEO5741434.1 site-specific integrase [Streptococcus agalactiae]
MAIRKAKNGGWIVDVSGGIDPVTFKRIRIVRKGLKSKKDAIELEYHLRVIELKEKNRDTFVTSDMLFSLLEKEDNQNHRKISYLTTQRNNYDRHIKTYFQQVDMKKVTYKHIYRFRESLKEKSTKQNSNEKLSNNTINKIMILVKKMFDSGIRNELITKNPCQNLRKLPIKKPELHFWGIEEFLNFKSLITEDEYQYNLFFTLAYFTGMRMGEILALTWNDVNFYTSTIHVTKSVYYVNKTNHVNSTKTRAGTRYITLNQKLLNTLKEWKNKQSEILSQFTTSTQNLQVIQSTPVTVTKNMIDKKFKQILQRDPNLKRIRIHDFRHSHASLLINQGEDYLVVKERLGHASITTTIDTYSHLYPSKQKSIADKLDDLY